MIGSLVFQSSSSSAFLYMVGSSEVEWPPDPVGDRLDERGPPARPGLVDGRLRRLVDGEDVVPVDLDSLEAVGLRLDRDVLAGRLPPDRERDGVLVVLAEEDHGTLKTPAKFMAEWNSPWDVAPSPERRKRDGLLSPDTSRRTRSRRRARASRHGARERHYLPRA